MGVQHLVDRTVVVGVDGSPSALQAVRWAAAEAARRKAPLRVVTAFAWQMDRVVARRIGFDEAEYRQIVLGESRRQLAEAAAVAADVVAQERVEAQLVVGHPIPVLHAEARRAGLLVVGDRGYGAIGGLLLGSVAADLAVHAECPVVLVRTADGTPVEDRTRPVVVGVDGSPVSESALAFAYEQAAARGVALIAVHTWWEFIADPALAPIMDWDAVESAEKVVLAERLAGWGEKYPDVRVHRVVTRAHPASALVEQSRGAQLVVVGSRGRGAAVGLLLGSVSHAMLHRAHCSIAVVRPPAQQQGLSGGGWMEAEM
jgi:nucleotide-binding universal stress UspA family protein